MPTKSAKEAKKPVTPKKVVVVEEVAETPVEAPKKETKPVEEKVEPAKPVVTEEIVTPEPEKKEEEPKEETKPVESTDAKAVVDKEVSEVEEVEESDEVEKPKLGKLLWIIIPTTLLVGALAGGIITYFSGVSNIDTGDESTPVATVSPDENEAPTPEPESSLKREDLKIQVLNGSGVSGAAGKGQSLLQDLGYVEVAVGNASSSDFTTTEISIKEEKSEYLDMLVEDLSDGYSVDEDTATLSETSTYDVVVTLGSK